MTNPYKSYLSIGEKLDKSKFILATFHLQSENQPPARNASASDAGGFDQTAGGVAAESSVGTWTDVSLQEKILWENLRGRVVELDEKASIIRIAYPLELFEPGNIPQFLSSIAGNVFGLSEVSALRLMDIELPEVYVRSFPGPFLGIDGIRKITGISDRPFLGSIIKPKLGLSAQEHIAASMEVYDSGIDLVKDDENLTSQTFNNFYTRVDEGTKRMKEAGYLKEGRQKIYAYNITASYEEMLKRAEYVVDRGGNCLMMDVLTAGFASVCGIRNRNFGKIIHAHRAMHAAFTRSKQYGISMLVIAKLARLAGVDSLHTGLLPAVFTRDTCLTW
nr:RuBisCO long chain, Form III-c [uncultured bacterium]